MRLCWFGIYTPEYARNDVLLTGLRRLGTPVIEIQAPARSRFRYLNLWRRLRRARGQFDVVYTAFPAPVAVLVAKLATRRPVVMDAFYSMFDAVIDRGEYSRFHPRTWRLWLLDWLAILAADLVITDTAAHRDYWSRWPFVRAAKIRVVYIGAHDDRFPVAPPRAEPPIEVIFHGTYIPLQGVARVVEAAALLRDRTDIHFTLIGDGQEFEAATAQARALDVPLAIIPRVPLAELPGLLAPADIILGIFGATPKAQRVIPHKVYTGVALGKAVITADTPAIREVFGADELSLIPHTATALAAAITALADHPEQLRTLAARGQARYHAELRPELVAATLLRHLQSGLPNRGISGHNH